MAVVKACAEATVKGAEATVKVDPATQLLLLTLRNPTEVTARTTSDNPTRAAAAAHLSTIPARITTTALYTLAT